MGRRRLAQGLAAALLLVAGVSAFALHGLSQVQDRLHEIAQVNNQQQRCAVEMREHVEQLAAGARDMVLEDDVAQMRPIIDRIGTESAAYDSAEATLAVLLADDAGASPQEHALFARIAADKALAWPLLTRVIALGADNQDVEARQLFLVQAKPLLNRWLDTLTQLADLQEQQNQHAAREAHLSYLRALATLAVLGVLTLLVGLAAAWSFASPARD